MYTVIAIALVAAATFYFNRSNVPLWQSLGHVPLGIVLIGVGM